MTDHFLINIDHRFVKLGKTAPVDWPLKMAMFADDNVLPTPPAAFSNSHGVKNWGMMCNRDHGCCVIAAKFHAVQTYVMSEIQSNVPRAFLGVIHPSDDLIMRYYENWAGYVEGDPSTDTGMDMTTSWKNCLNQGLAGYKFLGFVSPDPANKLHIMQSIALFGGVDLGLQLPVEWQNQKVWDVVRGAQPGSWGGHDTWCVDYDANGVWVVTWGYLQFMTWAALAWACDEAHTAVSSDFNPIPGFDLDKMFGALRAVSN
jgi:hypothetical protein